MDIIGVRTLSLDIMNILAFAASNSRNSINKQLVTYAVTMLSNSDVSILDLNDFEMPIYSIDRENLSGIPDQAHRFFELIGQSDALVISYAEHNGSYSAAFKNLFDWTSRINPRVYQDKPMVLLSTSPGPGGASRVLESAKTSAPFFGGKIVKYLSVPSFQSNFDSDAGKLTNPELDEQLKLVMTSLKI